MAARRIAVLIVFVAVLAVPAASHASFPGQNGKIAFSRGGNLWTMNPDGTNQVQLTSTTQDSQPNWSADATKIAFTRNFEIYTMNADGSGVARLTTNNNADLQPAWAPDGTKIAFGTNRDGNPNYEIYVMNADGTSQTRITNNAAVDEYPAWSPDGTRIAFDTNRDGNFEIYTMNPDGTNQTRLTNNATIDQAPSWSPDGAKILFGAKTNESSHIWVMNADGTNQTPLTSTAAGDGDAAWSPDGRQIVFDTNRDGPAVNNFEIYEMNADGTNQTRLTNDPALDDFPDWQPVFTPSPGYARPKGATPFQTYFTVAYKPCMSPNRQHGAPLAVLSCSPPLQASDYLTVGTLDANGQQAKAVGSVRFDVKQGNPATPANEADLKVIFAMKDVRNKSDLSDYTGELQPNLVWRDTDKWSGPIGAGGGTEPATSQDLNIPYAGAVPCAATADTTVGSTCNVTTTLNSIVAGIVEESRRMNLELGQVQVWDGGADGVGATTQDDTLFLTEGIFVP